MNKKEVIIPPNIKMTSDINRITICLQIVHESIGALPVVAESRFCDDLHIKEQSFYRQMKINAEDGWVPLQLGWLGPAVCGLFVVRNMAGTSISRNLTAEETDQLNKMVLLVSSNKAGCAFRLPPKYPFFAIPEDISSVHLRSLHGEIPVSIWIFPK